MTSQISKEKTIAWNQRGENIAPPTENVETEENSLEKSAEQKLRFRKSEAARIRRKKAKGTIKQKVATDSQKLEKKLKKKNITQEAHNKLKRMGEKDQRP